MKESDIIRAIHQRFPDRFDITSIGIGDDCAVLNEPCPLVTTDASVEGVHFDFSFMTFADAAYRCLASNLSDIAAMGGRAVAWTLALGLGCGFLESDLQAGLDAMGACLLDHGLPDAWLVGGDVVRSPHVFMSVTMWGKCETPDKTWTPVTRAGARPGDILVLMGQAGYAAAGLELLQKYGSGLEDAHVRRVVDHFLRPVALTRLGPALACEGLVRAMMDTSDGLFADLPRLLERSGVGAEIDLDVLDRPDQPLDAAAAKTGRPSWYYRVYGGEDYGLLAAVPANALDRVENLAYLHGVPMFRIGKVVPTHGIRWLKNGMPENMADNSFCHFG